MMRTPDSEPRSFTGSIYQAPVIIRLTCRLHFGTASIRYLERCSLPM